MQLLSSSKCVYRVLLFWKLLQDSVANTAGEDKLQHCDSAKGSVAIRCIFNDEALNNVSSWIVKHVGLH